MGRGACVGVGYSGLYIWILVLWTVDHSCRRLGKQLRRFGGGGTGSGSIFMGMRYMSKFFQKIQNMI